MKFKFINILFLILPVFYSCEQGNRKERLPDEETVPQSPVERTANKTIVFFGNSLTAGYGLEPSEAFPALIQKKIDSLDLDYKVVNAGLSGETTAGGKNRIEWVLRQPLDVFILELGANDGLRGIAPEETKRNLQEIINKVKGTYPEAEILLVGMQVPPSMGSTFSESFKNVYPQLAEENNIELVPFLLEGVGGERDLNLEDGIHPNKEGHRILAENVWSELKQMLN